MSSVGLNNVVLKIRTKERPSSKSNNHSFNLVSMNERYAWGDRGVQPSAGRGNYPKASLTRPIQTGNVNHAYGNIKFPCLL